MYKEMCVFLHLDFCGLEATKKQGVSMLRNVRITTAHHCTCECVASSKISPAAAPAEVTQDKAPPCSHLS